MPCRAGLLAFGAGGHANSTPRRRSSERDGGGYRPARWTGAVCAGARGRAVQAHGGKRLERKGGGVRGSGFLPWAWPISCLGASAISFAEGGALFSHRSKSWSLSRRSCLSLSRRFPEAKQSATEQRAGGAVRRLLRSGAMWSARKAGESGILSPGKGRDFHGAKHDLASGAGSDGRVKGATLARAFKLRPRGRVVRTWWRRARSAPEAVRLDKLLGCC